jgi:hypothetical protein
MNDIMGVYRVHEGGVIQKFKKKSLEERIQFNTGMLYLYYFLYKKTTAKIYHTNIINLLSDQRKNYLLLKEYNEAKTVSRKLLKHGGLSIRTYIAQFITIVYPSFLSERYKKNLHE